MAKAFYEIWRTDSEYREEIQQINFLELDIKKEMMKIPTFFFSIDRNYETDLTAPYNGVYIKIYRNNEEVLRGQISEMEIRETSYFFSGKSSAEDWDDITDLSGRWRNSDTNYMAGWLADRIGWTLGEVENLPVKNHDYAYVPLIEELDYMAGLHSKEFGFDEVNKKIHYKSEIGTDKSNEIRFIRGVNIDSLSVKREKSEAWTRVIALGAGEGAKQVKVVVGNTSGKTKVFTHKSIKTVEDLTRYANSKLKEGNLPEIVTYEGKMLSPIFGVELGDKVWVEDGKNRIDEAMRVMSIHMSFNETEQFNLVLANRNKTLSDFFKRMEKGQRTLANVHHSSAVQPSSMIQVDEETKNPIKMEVENGNFVNVTTGNSIGNIENNVGTAQSTAEAAQADAINAQTTANTALQNANNAITDANEANTLLADFSSDSKLTAIEKQATKKEWDIIASEKATIEAQGTAYGITAEKQTYTDAYSALSTYVSPLLSSLTTTSTIDGNVFRSKFKAYYDARTVLLKKVSDIAKNLADTAQEAANQAKTDAATAQGTANTAVEDAENARLLANEAKTTADLKEDKIYKQSSAPAHAVGRIWINTGFNPHIMYRSTGSAWVKLSATTAEEIGAVDNVTFEEEIAKKQSNIPISATAPSSPKLNDLWLNVSVTPYVLQRYDGSAWQKASPTNANEVGAEKVMPKDKVSPSDPFDGQMWLDTTRVPNVLKRYDGASGQWISATPTTASEVGAYDTAETDDIFETVDFKADTAITSATTANDLAGAAQTSATNANTKSDSAVSTANTANSNANTAKTDATNAKNTANTASSLASSAQTDATNAKTTANSAISRADQATASANLAIRELYDPTFLHGKEFWASNYTGETLPSITAGTVVKEGFAGGNALQITGSEWLYSRNAIPVDTNRTYLVRFRVKQTVDATSGDSRIYAGVSTLGRNYEAITGGAGTHRYCAGAGIKVTEEDGWQVIEGTISGVGDNHNNFREGTAYIRPMAIVNYSSGNGTVLVDMLEFIDITEANNANNNATAADGKAVNAQSTANSATSLASSAQGDATNALTTAGNASSTANTAKSTADTAKSTADTAKGTADTAYATAGSASTTATNADTKAGQALTNAATADSKAVNAQNTANSKENQIYKQSTAPSHSSGRLWVDLSKTPNVMYRSTGSTWVKLTPTQAAEVGAYDTSTTDSKVGTATSLANAAQADATNADTKAGQALSNAATADGKAVNAQSTANTANSKATDAKNKTDATIKTVNGSYFLDGGTLLTNSVGADSVKANTFTAEKMNIGFGTQQSATGTDTLALHNSATISNTTGANPLRDDTPPSKTDYASFGSGSSNGTGSEGSNYLQVDLGLVKEVGAIKAWFYSTDSRSYWYKIKVSQDGTNWFYLIGNAEDNSWQESNPARQRWYPTIVTFPALKVRYIRIYGAGNTVNSGNHIYSLQIYNRIPMGSIKNSDGTVVINDSGIQIAPSDGAEAVTTINGSGVTVKDGSFYLVDAYSGLKYPTLKKTNLVADHSFELMIPTGGVGIYDDFDFVNPSDYYGGWRINNGTPRVLTNINTESNFRPVPFGNQALVFSASSYVSQYVPIAENTDYYLSGHFQTNTMRSPEGAEPRFFYVFINESGGTISSGYLNFPKTPPNNTPVRYGGAVRSPAGAVSMRISPMVLGSGWLICDGIELVMGTEPSWYDPENSLWSFRNGVGDKSGTFLNAPDRSMVIGSIRTYNPMPALVHDFLTLINGWQNYGSEYVPAVFTKSADNMVHIRGFIKGGSSGSHIARLPVGCRPIGKEVFSVITSGGTFARVDISSDGLIQLAQGNSGFVSLSGITFRAEN